MVRSWFACRNTENSVMWLICNISHRNISRNRIAWLLEWVLLKIVFVVQSLSHVGLFATPWTAACQASLSFTISMSLLKFMSIDWWCHPTISSSVVPFSFCLQSFPASGSFSVSQFFPSCDQSIGVSASASVLPMNIQDWFPLRLTDLISCSPRDSQESSPTQHLKSINFSVLSLLYGPTLSSIHGYQKNHSFD